MKLEAADSGFVSIKRQLRLRRIFNLYKVNCAFLEPV